MPPGGLLTHVDPARSRLSGRGLPTLSTVAARAGVSRATASRVLRGDPRVGAAARAAVEHAAEEVAYVPNQAARTLAARRPDAIGFLVGETTARLFDDPYFPAMLAGAQAVVAAADRPLLFLVAATEPEWRRVESVVAGGLLAGLLGVSLHGDDGRPARFETLGIATVLSGRPRHPAPHGPVWVDADNVAGGRLATEYLISTGRRHIATVTGPPDLSAGRDRLTGYRQALAAAGRRPPRGGVVTGDFSPTGGFTATNDLLAAAPRIDAVFAASDLTALGVVDALRAAGRRVPDDVAVVGFDDVREAASARPALTTVRQPIGELGATMARLLLRRLAGEPVATRTVLPVELVRRASA